MEPEELERLRLKLRDDLRRALDDVAELHWSRYIRRRVIEIAAANPEVNAPNYFWEWLHRMYADSACATIRRLLDKDRRAASLAGIVLRLTKHPDLYTRSYFLSRYTSDLERRRAEPDCRRLVGSGEELDPALWLRLLADTQARCCKVVAVVDQSIAHNDRQKSVTNLKFGELDDAIEAVGALYKQLADLLTHTFIQDLTPQPDDLRWDSIFAVPWIGEQEAGAAGEG